MLTGSKFVIIRTLKLQRKLLPSCVLSCVLVVGGGGGGM